MLRHAELWLPDYLRGRLARRRGPGPAHVLFCMVDHFEPDWGGAALEEQVARVERWVREYPALAGRHRDADGRPPRYTFFYPAETYREEVAERLAVLCRRGLAEVELHLHHDNDTAETLTRKLEQAKAQFARHGLLAREPAGGRVRFGFIHGNWALDNSHPEGRWCGVNNELDVLRQAGCYADFTMPSAPSPTQTRKINSVYYATDDPARPKSHDTGSDVTVGQDGHDRALLMVQGPLTLNWRRRKYGLLPRLETGELSASNPPSPQRAGLWVREGISVRSREEWVVVKVYAHGAKPANADVLLGRPMDELLTHLETAYGGRLHYVTARELYNLIRAAQRGEAGDPGSFRDAGLVNPLGIA